MRLWKAMLLAAMIVGHGSQLAERAAIAGDHVTFNRDIRPILSDNCFRCHGPDEKQRQAGLRLDVPDFAQKSAESGATAIVPGKLDESELIRRITSSDADLHMPPINSGKNLTAAQIELLKRWIADGAEYQGHWAFITPVRPDAPQVRNAKFKIRNEIDNFILDRLQAEGLKPSPEASKETLIRRVSLDLTGIPPTIAEIDAFLADSSPAAYEKVVDRLLKSPRYGERMAMQWLDFARYADSNGFQVDSSRFQWPWRDWVIKAFNDNMPFDQFTVEQLAGDLLPNATRSQLVATGFNRNHRLNGEGGIIAEEWRVETVIDRVETTGMTWLALTLNCCRCHDHKYDPITQREFYQLFSFFNNVPESGTLQGETKNTDPVIPVPTEQQEAELTRLDNEQTAAEAKLAETTAQLPEFLAAWEPDFKARLNDDGGTVWHPLTPKEVKSEGGAKLAKQSDGTYLASGKNPPHDTYTIIAPLAAGQFTGLLLECLPDPSLPNQSLGRYPNGNFVLSAVEAEITAPDSTEPLKSKVTRVEATYSQAGWDISLVLDDNPANGWAVDGPTRRDPTTAMFIFDAPISVPEKATLTVRLKHTAIDRHNIGRFRLSTTRLPPSTVKIDGAKIPESLKNILALDADKRSTPQKAELEKFFRANVDSPVRHAESAVAKIKKKRDAVQATIPNVMVMREADKPREAFRLIRGEYDKKGDLVTAALPAAFPPLPAGQPINRLGLAKWLVDPSHPLTARVWVNRTWEKFFGTGLVKTTENIGSQAEWPSHPELLDWLAVEFMQGSRVESRDSRVRNPETKPWDMKALQKLIVMSATYRQASAASPEEELGRAGDGAKGNAIRLPHSPAPPRPLSATNTQLDPDNRLLSRGPRFRLPAELIRDQALAISGLLVEKIGGPSVRPYMPDGIWDETSRYGDLRGYKHDTGDGLYRRTLYTIWKRTAAPPTMLLFDAPNREVCQVKRSRTNTPLQALVLLNEITYIEAARKLAEQMILDGGSAIEERITHGFRRATSRRPTSDELRVLADGLAADVARFRQNVGAAKQLLAQGESKSNTNLDPAELAAYTLTANVLLNIDEVVSRE